MKKTMIVFGLIALMALSITYANAQGPGSGSGYKGMPCQEGWGPGKGLSLTPEQKAQYQELRRKFNEENAQLIGAMVTKRMELRSLWSNPKADPKAIADKEKELRDLRNQMGEKMVQMKLEARKFLTPEQIAQLGQGFGKGPRFGHGRMMGPGGKMSHSYGACY